jgi:hypothetical protein
MQWGIAPSIVLGVIFLWIFYDGWRFPELGIVDVFSTERRVLYDVDRLSPFRGDSGRLQYEACTIKVVNKRRRFFNRPAKNCIPWLLLDTGRCYRLAWVGGDRTTTLNLNVNDVAEVDLCAIITKNGNIYAPSCSLPSSHPIFIGNGTEGLTGIIAISSTNARRARKNIVLYSYERATGNGSFQTLAVNLGKLPRVESTPSISDFATRGLLLFSFAGLGLVYTSGWVRVLSWIVFGFAVLLLAMLIIQSLLLLYLKLRHYGFTISPKLITKWKALYEYIYQLVVASIFAAPAVTFLASWITKSSQISGFGGQVYIYAGLAWTFIALALLLIEASTSKIGNKA